MLYSRWTDLTRLEYIEEMDRGKRGMAFPQRRNGGHMTITFNELARLLSDMESDSGEGDGIVLWGWERFFTELSSFLRNIDRQYASLGT